MALAGRRNCGFDSCTPRHLKGEAMCESCYYFRDHCLLGQMWPFCTCWPRTTDSTLIEEDNERMVEDRSNK